MTPEKLREKVARALAHLAYNSEVAWQEFGPEADAAIALCMEEAAKALYSVPRWDREIFDSLTQTADGSLVYIDEAEAAIRALKDKT